MLTTRNVWVIVRPAEDVPGQWVGHCLDFDIVSLGTSLEHALKMTAEAVFICIHDDMHNGRGLSRKGAPDECWDECKRVVANGTYGPPPKDRPVILVTQFQLQFEETEASDEPNVEQLPPAWMIGDLGRNSSVPSLNC